MAPFPEKESRGPAQYVGPINEYFSRSSRIAGHNRVNFFPEHAPTPMYVVGHETFAKYIQTGHIDPEAEQQLIEAFEDIRVKNPEKGVYVGRGFFVPGNDAPNGPRTAAIREEKEFLQTVEQFYKYAIEQGYNVEDADIALVLHPFIDATEGRLFYGEMALKKDEQLPWTGGYIVPDPVPGAEHQILVGATFGADEATQSFSHDTFKVDPERQVITNKTIAFKQQTYVSRTGSDYEIVEIPKRFQQEQALTDEELLTIAVEARKIFTQYPDSRIEFITQRNGVYFREIAPWEAETEGDFLQLQPGEEITDTVVCIRNGKDVDRVIGPRTIVYFGPETFRDRSTDLFAQVANREGVTEGVGLIYGELETTHAKKILRDAGYGVIHTGDTKYSDGTRLRISLSEDGAPFIEHLDPYEDAIVHFSDVKRLYKGEAGMKVARLAMMKDWDIQVPDGFSIKSEIIWRYLDEIGVLPIIAQLDTADIHNTDRLKKILHHIQQKIYKSHIPDALVIQIQKALVFYGFDRWMIRSSGSEDGEKRSLAGLYASPADVPTEEVPEKMKLTIASYFSLGSVLAVRKAGEQPYHMVIGVGVHEFIPETPGTIGIVVFTSHDSIKLEIVNGSPEGIVAGTATEYLHIDIKRNGAEQYAVINKIGSENVRVSDDTVQAVVTTVSNLERIFHCYQDDEILATPERGIVVVQARPR